MGKNERYEWTEPVARRLARFFIGIQIRITGALNKRVATMSKQVLKFSLVLFCIIGGGTSLLVACIGLFAKQGERPVLKVEKIRVLPQMYQGDSSTYQQQPYLEEEFFKKMKVYQNVMDSLGEPIQPGLLDSIRILESYLK